MDLPQTDNYQQLFLNDVHLLDVRAPVEYLQGAFPLAKNLPLINDDEREAIGIRYKEMGQEKAIELGHELVKDKIKATRVMDWAEFTQQHPHGVLYCFRGGMRSKISQQWILEKTGVVYPRVKGGYKALRRFLIDELDNAAKQIQPVILGGRTGSGKTLLLNRITHKIDLEDIYQHRGSAFGKHVTPQPSQIDIENSLSIQLLKHRKNNITRLVLEDEAPAIGSRRLPDTLVHTMRQSPIILLEAGIDERVDIIFDEYIVGALTEHQELLGQTKGFDAWADNLLQALDKIQRRLGGEHHKKIRFIMEFAIDKHRNAGELSHHKEWIKNLLVGYYDPMYDYQLSKKIDRVVFRGENESILEHLNNFYGISC
jgi:tRNA 2-selenouridine synthase